MSGPDCQLVIAAADQSANSQPVHSLLVQCTFDMPDFAHSTRFRLAYHATPGDMDASPLVELPAELRLAIYEHCLTFEPAIKVHLDYRTMSVLKRDLLHLDCAM